MVDITGMKKMDALFALAREGYSPAEAEAYWKENGSKQSTGFAAEFYAELEDGEMSLERFDEIIEAGSKNVQNHYSHYNNIRKMANAIWAQK